MLETLSDKKISDLGFFNADYVRTMIQEHLHNREKPFTSVMGLDAVLSLA